MLGMFARSLKKRSSADSERHSGAAGLEQALAALWGDGPTQRCTVHKHRNLLAHALNRLHEEVSADYTDIIYATSSAEIEERLRAFIRKWRLNARRWSTAWRKPVTASSPLPDCPAVNGRAHSRVGPGSFTPSRSQIRT